METEIPHYNAWSYIAIHGQGYMGGRGAVLLWICCGYHDNKDRYMQIYTRSSEHNGNHELLQPHVTFLQTTGVYQD